ncbi:MAG: hypothetical protein JW852_06655 [Spirochaetales bacterium]|nr:hypothetical protein [Spirochaetales bacterium]
MIILTLNCGSSSVKYQLYNFATGSVMAKGAVERVTVGGSSIKHRVVHGGDRFAKSTIAERGNRDFT